MLCHLTVTSRKVECRVKTIDKRIKILFFAVVSLILVGCIGFFAVNRGFLTRPDMQVTTTPQQAKIVPTQPGVQTIPGTTFIASLDTMKESRDTETRPLSSKQISAIV